MKYLKCENCGCDLIEIEGGGYACEYCKRTYYADSLDKAYHRIYQNLADTAQGVVTELLLQEKIEKISACRQGVYRAVNGQFVDSQEVLKWAQEILKLCPGDAQATFYLLATEGRFSELNRFMERLSARDASYLVEGFVDYLTNGRFVEDCALSLSDLIGRAFSVNSKEYAECHKKINLAVENEKSGIFNVELPRDVFVAYSSKDKEQAYELVEYLEKMGFTCFIAMRNLAKGVDAELRYNERLKKAIDSCKVFVLVSSKNSRSRNCDAYKMEMRYVKAQDIARSENSDLANLHYELYLEKNRNRCKPRVEYLIEEYGSSVYEQEVKKFFGGLTWCTELSAVADTVYNYVENYEELTKPKVKGSETLEQLRAKLTALEEQARKEKEERNRKEELEQRKLASIEACKCLGKLLRGYRGQDREVWIPEGIEVIGLRAFENHTILEKIHIPESVKEINVAVFAGCCNLQEIILPSGLKKLGASVFQDCDSLQKIVIPKSVEDISMGTFYKCNAKLYAEAEEKPSGWLTDANIVFGYKGE